MSNPVRVERDGPLAIMTFDHPPVNLWDKALDSGFRDALTDIEANPPRALLIRAEGRVFTGGVDVSVFDEAA